MHKQIKEIPKQKTIQELGIERIRAIADYIETIPLKRFYFAAWAGSEWKGKKDLSCGTKACALGWATTMPMFQKLGLHLVKYSNMPLINLNGCDPCDIHLHTKIAHDIFGIDLKTFEFLFIPSSDLEDVDYNCNKCPGDITSREWVRHARRIADELEAEL